MIYYVCNKYKIIKQKDRTMENLTTMITPFLKDGSVDYETAKKYVKWYYDNGLDGIFAVCQSSEIFYLSLEERVKLNSVVYNYAKELEKSGDRKFTVVSSGHVSDKFEDQVEELTKIYNSGTDCLILITNRLDINNEGDDVFIANAEKLIKALPDGVKLGLYECPYPYKRLVTPRILKWCLETGKFYYMKDTCCDVATMKERCSILDGSQFRLLNANCQTLLESVKNGAKGYCGIMCNFHPSLYTKLKQLYLAGDNRAEFLQSIIGTFGFIEVGLAYPLTAKYSMNLCGNKTELISRVRKTEELTDYAKFCVEEMKYATDEAEKIF